MSTIPEWAQQISHGVRIDWGAAGAQAIGPSSAAIIVIDVLSFKTSVSLTQGSRTRGGRRTVSVEQPWRPRLAMAGSLMLRR
ncbi:hypothetical protein [Nocardia sp. NPDC020380]|uniref:hypothetical protein n=1 Tax=Nocardia sp. NPDC020380 TaxID=3364309 RepID=UPI00379660B3